MNLWEYAAKQPLLQAEQTAPQPSPLSREQDAAQQEREAVTATYKRQQEAIQRAAQRCADVLKGLKRGESLPQLFVWACECIGAITGDPLFAAQARADLTAIYGIGLQQPESAAIELEAVQARLAMLTRPELMQEPEDSRRRIDAAIKSHRERETMLQAIIERGGQ